MPATERIYYRTKDGRADYGFQLVTLSNGTERAYITSQPSYQGRDDSSHPTHRLTDEGGRLCVSWNPGLKDRAVMKRIIALWAEYTQDYINSGKDFGPAH